MNQESDVLMYLARPMVQLPILIVVTIVIPALWLLLDLPIGVLPAILAGILSPIGLWLVWRREQSLVSKRMPLVLAGAGLFTIIGFVVVMI
jgi:hypothetical protein